MNPILHKTLALTLSASLLSAYGTPAFAAREVISEETTLSDVAYENYTEGAVLNGSNLTLRDVNFSGNSNTALGGAIENKDYQAKLDIQGGSFTNNSANAGGALFLRGDNIIKDAAFNENKAMDTDTEPGGGAIYLALPKKGLPLNTLQMDNVSFTNNSAKASDAEGGGAVGLFSKADLNHVTFTSNSVEGGTGGGGAMFLGAESLTTLNQNTFKDNTSSINGGALSTREYARGNNKAAKLDITDSAFTGNKAAEKGGAFYNTFYNSNTKAGSVSISNTSFINNEADEGGAIYNNGNPDLGGNQGALTIAASTFEGNKGTNGGAIMNQNALDVAQVTFTNNKATEYGGAMYINTLKADGTLNDGVTNITDSVFDGNAASLGGAVFVHNGVANIKNSRFINNTADYSGAIFTGSTPYMVLSIENSLFENNTAKGVGAVQAMSKTTIKNSTFKSNAATETDEDGGAMFVGAVGKVEVDSSVFEGNTTMARGGAIATRSYDLANNKDATLDITNSTFTANKAATTGGALDNFLYNSINAADSVYVANSTFTKNEAADGGAIYNHGELDKNNHAAVITVKDSVFTGNTATNNGGAIYNVAQGVFNLEGNNTFADNTANGVANDIYNDGILNINSGTTTLAGGIAGAGALQVKGSAALNLGQSTAQADSITLDNGASLAVEFANNAMGNLKANTITIGENAEDTAKLTVTLSRDFLTDTTAVSHELTNGTAVTNGSFALADVSNALYQVTMDNNVVTAVRKAQEETQQEIVNAGGNANDMNVLNAFTTSADMGSAAANQTADLINTLAQTDVAGAVQATEAVAPEVASAKQVVHGSITREVFNTLQTRMDNVSGNAPQAFALADEQSVSTQGESAVWLQGLLNKSHKEATDTDAFTGRSTGLAFGLDKQLSDALLLGAGYAYTHTNVSSTLRHDRILGDNFFVYGQYRPSRFFVQGSLGYGDSKYEESKYLPGLTVKGDYHVKNYSAQAVAGYEWTEALIPTVGVRYISLQQEGYKDSSDQAISAEQNNYLSGLAGITLKGAYQATANLRLMPQLRAGLSYDFVSDQAQGTVVLPNGSNYAVSGERLHRLGFETGVSVGAYVFENVEALLGYEGNFRQDYASHTGTLKFRYLF